jgi:hypothetical protein
MAYKVKKKKETFAIRVYGETQFGKPFVRTLRVKGDNARKVYNSVKQDNAVIDILSIKKID